MRNKWHRLERKDVEHRNHFRQELSIWFSRSRWCRSLLRFDSIRHRLVFVLVQNILNVCFGDEDEPIQIFFLVPEKKKVKVFVKKNHQILLLLLLLVHRWIVFCFTEAKKRERENNWTNEPITTTTTTTTAAAKRERKESRTSKRRGPKWRSLCLDSISGGDNRIVNDYEDDNGDNNRVMQWWRHNETNE